MRGRGHRRLAANAFQRWGKLHYDALVNSRVMPTPMHATLRLPVANTFADTAAAAMHLRLSTNHRAVAEWWQDEYGDFLRADDDDAAATGTSTSDDAAAVIAASSLAAHVGPPAAPLGYPAYIAEEAQQWTAGVLRGEAYAYTHAMDGSSGWVTPPPPPQGTSYLSPVRWIQQPLLDGVVAQRLTAHAGVTTEAMLEAHRTATSLGRQLPPFDLSPFYAASGLLDRWCLFGESSSLLPLWSTAAAAAGPATMAADARDPAEHHRRAAELALAAAVLPNYNAAWLNGAVVSDGRTRRSVLIVGPRSSGKTTLALHCVAPQADNEAGSDGAAELRLAAAEHFFVGSGSPVTRMTNAPPTADSAPSVFISALPHRIRVGIGAVLGTLRPNPALAAAAMLPPFLQTDAGLRALLANPDGVLWRMSMHYDLRLQDICGCATAWQPAGVTALSGVVLLDWDVGELAAAAAPVAMRTHIRRLPLHVGGLEELLTRGRDYLFRGHHLLRSTYDGATEGPARLSQLLSEEWATNPPTTNAAPSLHCIEGSVNFDAATQLVRRLLTK